MPVVNGRPFDGAFLVAHESVGAMAALRVTRRNTARGVIFADACMVLVMDGRKTLSDIGAPKRAEAGDLVLIPAGAAADVTAEPPDVGPYRGVIIALEAGVLDRFTETYPEKVAGKAPLGQISVLRQRHDVTAVVNRVIADFEAGLMVDADLLRHRLLEILLMLALGDCIFAGTRPGTVAQRVGTLVARDLARDWTAAEIAAELATSEATLRRRLAAEHMSFKGVLTEARLGKGLFLLQSTGRDVASVAFDIGYRSPSHFTVRFKKRFGIAPSEAR
jgi:AraC-like DNA-binding protein